MNWVEAAELICLWIVLSALSTWAIGSATSWLTKWPEFMRRRKPEPEQLDLFAQSQPENDRARGLEQIWACRRFGMCNSPVSCNDNGYCAARGRP